MTEKTPPFLYIVADSRQRFELAVEALSDWKELLGHTYSNLLRYESRQLPDQALEACLLRLCEENQIVQAQSILPFVPPSSISSVFVSCANNNNFEGVKNLLPYVDIPHYYVSALQSYLGVILPRDPQIFDTLFPLIPDGLHPHVLGRAVQSRHFDLAAKVIPVCPPWETARLYSKSPAVLQDLGLLWAQSISDGTSALPSPKNRSATYWSRRLPGMKELVRRRKLLDLAEKTSRSSSVSLKVKM